MEPYTLPAPRKPDAHLDEATSDPHFVSALQAAALNGGGRSFPVSAPLGIPTSDLPTFWERVAARLTDWKLVETGLRDAGATRFLVPKN
jgi:hypothetical protein